MKTDIALMLDFDGKIRTRNGNPIQYTVHRRVDGYYGFEPAGTSWRVKRLDQLKMLCGRCYQFDEIRLVPNNGCMCQDCFDQLMTEHKEMIRDGIDLPVWEWESLELKPL